MKRKIKIVYTCCNACSLKHANKFTGWLHFMILKLNGVDTTACELFSAVNPDLIGMSDKQKKQAIRHLGASLDILGLSHAIEPLSLTENNDDEPDRE